MLSKYELAHEILALIVETNSNCSDKTTCARVFAVHTHNTCTWKTMKVHTKLSTMIDIQKFQHFFLSVLK